PFAYAAYPARSAATLSIAAPAAAWSVLMGPPRPRRRSRSGCRPAWRRGATRAQSQNCVPRDRARSADDGVEHRGVVDALVAGDPPVPEPVQVNEPGRHRLPGRPVRATAGAEHRDRIPGRDVLLRLH